MTVHLEIFATARAAPADLWSLVGDPRRLPAWTDVRRVTAVVPEPPAPGSEITVEIGGHRLTWWVTNREARLLEARTDLADGRLGVGVNVQPHGSGSRLVLAASFEGRSARAELAFRLGRRRRLLRSFDRWARNATALDGSSTRGG